ncbi:hypothetical protein SAMN04488694_107165 [Natrinema hispanicum]|uniref:Uncharacterized protein n=2 Tax=Natrinema hispanicum TaxID=392421 RepID=A0A1I0EXY8_9EURY|nr:hypothetical protein SAMN04488694_107165 [Natrinema hispanicum]
MPYKMQNPDKMTQANKRIPVTEETHEQLHQLKGTNQSYDELLRELAQERNRKELQQKAREIELKDSGELTPLEDI